MRPVPTIASLKMYQVKIYRGAAGPRVLRQLTESVQAGLESGEFSDEAKAANEALVESYKVPYLHSSYSNWGCFERGNKTKKTAKCRSKINK